jgi:hypothetical protein
MPTDEQPTLGQEIIDWIEANCRVPEGALDAILRIYDNVVPTRRAIISVGRKSGKTATAAFLLLAHLCGPATAPNSQLYSTAQSRDQAALLFALAAKIIRMSAKLSTQVVVKDSLKQLVCPALALCTARCRRKPRPHTACRRSSLLTTN